MSKITIAIDGYSGCGKSSTAKAVARKLKYAYIDSGAMYRAVTLYLLRNGIGPENRKKILEGLDDISISFQSAGGMNQTILNGEVVEDEIRSMEVSEKVSEVSTIPEVRKAMVAQQQQMGKGKGVVMDGRDIGTVVFPDAELKVFMTADTIIRAKRRQLELKEKGMDLSLDEIVGNLEKRDRIDTTRDESPLLKAPDAVVVDTSHLTFEQQVDKVVEIARKRIAKKR